MSSILTASKKKQKTDIKEVSKRNFKNLLKTVYNLVKLLYNIIVMSGDINFTSEWHNRGKLV